MTTPTHSPTETVSDPTYLFHPDNHLLDKKPTESDKDMEWTTNPPTEPTVEKWEEILKKAEKYVRANSVYYGNDQYRLSMTDWLYFIKGVANEVEAHSVQEAKAEERENERERILEAIQPAVNDFMAGANTLAKNKMVDSDREVRENIQYIVYVIRDDKKGLSTLNTKASLKQEEQK